MRSGTARVLKGSHSFSCTPTCLSSIRMSHTCLCLPSYSRYSFADPGGMEGWVGLGGLLRNETDYLPEGSHLIPLLTGLDVEQLRWSRPTRHRHTKPPLDNKCRANACCASHPVLKAAGWRQHCERDRAQCCQHPTDTCTHAYVTHHWLASSSPAILVVARQRHAAAAAAAAAARCERRVVARLLARTHSLTHWHSSQDARRCQLA